MSLDRVADLARQGYPEAAAEVLARLLDEAELDDHIRVEVDDRGGLIIDTPWDPVLLAELQRIKGLRRDKRAGVWRLPARKVTALLPLIDGLLRPFCSALGCSIGDGPPASREHQEAHRRICLGELEV